MDFRVVRDSNEECKDDAKDGKVEVSHIHRIQKTKFNILWVSETRFVKCVLILYLNNIELYKEEQYQFIRGVGVKKKTEEELNTYWIITDWKMIKLKKDRYNRHNTIVYN